MSIFGTSVLHDILTFITFVAFGIVANLFSKKISEKFNIIDYPNNSGLKIQKKPTPLSGGLALFLTLSIVLVMYYIFNNLIDPILLFYSLVLLLGVMLMGIVDDYLHLNANIRLLFYIFFAALAYTLYRGTLNFSLVFILPTIFLFAPGIVTATNMIDGMDGVCAGTAIISFIGFTIIGLWSQNHFLVIFSLAGITSLIPFLFFNFHPAKVFLGSSGSELLGFIFFILVLISMRGIHDYLLLPRILIIGIPIIDLVRVMAIRTMAGKSLLQGDRNHIYDLLSGNGLGQQKVWTVMMGSQALVVLIAIILNKLLVS